MYADMNGHVKGGPGTRRSMPLCAILLVGLELLSKAYHQALASCMTSNDHSSQHEYHPKSHLHHCKAFPSDYTTAVYISGLSD